MSKIFETQFEKGSYISRQGVVGIPTASIFKRTEKGIAWEDVDITSRVIYANTNTLVGDLTFVAWINPAGLGQGSAGKMFSNGQLYVRIVNTGRIGVTNNNGTLYYPAVNTVPLNQWNHILITRLANGTTVIYTNGKLGTPYAGSTATPVAGGNIAIGNNEGAGGSYDGQIARVELYDKILSRVEIASSYNEFLQATPVAIEKYPSYNPFSKPSDLSSVSDLIAAYNMIPSTGGVLVDVSDNDGNGVITGPISTLDGLRFDGVDDTVRLYIEAGIAVTVKTICFRIKLDTTTEEILEGGTGTELIYAAAGTLVYADYSTAYINGIETDTVVANQWMNIVITSETPVSNATATLGLNVIV